MLLLFVGLMVFIFNIYISYFIIYYIFLCLSTIPFFRVGCEWVLSAQLFVKSFIATLKTVLQVEPNKKGKIKIK